jgi:hypothetical protein
MNQEDILVWSDEGTWCYRYELPEMQHRSDDYMVLSFESKDWWDFIFIHGD